MLHAEVSLVGLLVGEKFGAFFAADEVSFLFLLLGIVFSFFTHVFKIIAPIQVEPVICKRSMV